MRSHAHGGDISEVIQRAAIVRSRQTPQLERPKKAGNIHRPLESGTFQTPKMHYTHPETA